MKIYIILYLTFICTISNTWSQSDLANKFYKNGLLKSKQGIYNEALNDFNSAIKENSNDKDFYLERGRVFEHLEEFDKALNDYNIVIELDNKFSAGYNNRGLIKRRLKDYDGALKDIEIAITLDPQNAVHYFNRGAIKAILDDYTNAMVDYNKAISLDPKMSYYYVERSRLKTKLNDYRGAMRDVNQATTLSPQYIYDKGYINYEFGKFNEAITDFTKAIHMGFDRASAYNMRAMSKKELGDLKGACEDWSIAGELGEVNVYSAMKRFCKNR